MLVSRRSTSTSTCSRRCARARAASCSRTRRPTGWWRRSHAVGDGEALLAPQITRRLVERFLAPPGAAVGPDELTEREHEVLELVARGLSNDEIGEGLVLCVPTVKTHVGRVLMKLGLRDRVQAVVLAYEAGLVTLPRRARAARSRRYPLAEVADLGSGSSASARSQGVEAVRDAVGARERVRVARPGVG